MDGRIDEILSFWFGNLDARGCASAERRKLWWTKSNSFDEEVRIEFLEDYEAIVAGERQRWRTTPRGTLATIVVLDQFSRNMFRGTSKAFAADPLAREICHQGIDAGFDEQLGFDERVFFYLPLEHSEILSDHERCTKLFADLRASAPNELDEDAVRYMDYAKQHRAIIERFGRYPHRNEILGRPSTEEELEFLKHPGSSF